MLDFTKHVATRLRHLVTPQSEPIPGSSQVPNSDTGYAWPVTKWVRLDTGAVTDLATLAEATPTRMKAGINDLVLVRIDVGVDAGIHVRDAAVRRRGGLRPGFSRGLVVFRGGRRTRGVSLARSGSTAAGRHEGDHGQGEEWRAH